MLKAWLTNNDRGCAIISLISFRIMHDILSWPALVFIGKLFITLIISFGLVCLRWNLEMLGDGLAVHFYFIRSHRGLFRFVK